MELDCISLGLANFVELDCIGFLGANFLNWTE
jgi:hypothetical protein